ncbi:hypothetical protein SUGI_0346050 [Cryptomeria japonica]|nr:hypothetical protein SUGI_0346050 [Cryptomeria japonica]
MERDSKEMEQEFVNPILMERDSKEMEQEFVNPILMERDSKEIEQESVTSIERKRELKEIERKSVTAIEGNGEECGLSKLPGEMKEMIFAKLSFESICSSLTVCKEWNCILSSQSFLSSLPTQNPWLLMCDKKENGNWNCVAYCFTTRKCRELSLSFLPDFKLDLSSTRQGLLLFRETPIQRLNICNPLLRSYAEIEMDLTNKFVSIVDGGNKEPYLIVFSKEKFSFEIYHYFQDSWRMKFQFAGES